MNKPTDPKPMPTTWLDRTIGWFNPRQGLRRANARSMLQRAYEGASKKDGWNPRRAGASATTDYQADARELRHRVRSLVSNVPVITQLVRVMVTCTVGTGIIPRWVGDANGSVAARWKAWVRVADYDGLLDFYGLQAKAWSTVKIDGEVLVRLRQRATGPTTVPLQLQLMEADWLDAQRNERRGTSEIINGIEYNARGERAAYWLFERHPGDVGLRATLRDSVRVPAEEIIHLFNPARPGQQSGISALASIVPKVRDLAVYQDAEQARKNLETRMGAIGEWDETLMGDTARIPESVMGKEGAGPATLDLGELAGGGIVGLPPGMRNPTFIQPTAAPGYVDYVKQQLKEIAAGPGVPYEFMTGDMSEVNFSSARVRTNQYRRDVECEQWTLFIPMFCDRIAARWLSMLELAPGPKAQDVTPEWTTPKWASPNPVQDVAADVAEVKAGFSSISEKIRQRGYDPEMVFTELKTDLARLQADGTLPLLAAWLGAANPLELLSSIGAQQDEKK